MSSKIACENKLEILVLSNQCSAEAASLSHVPAVRLQAALEGELRAVFSSEGQRNVTWSAGLGRSVGSPFTWYKVGTRHAHAQHPPGGHQARSKSTELCRRKSNLFDA